MEKNDDVSVNFKYHRQLQLLYLKKRYKFVNHSGKGRKHVKEMLYLLQQMIKQIRVLQLVKEALKGDVTGVTLSGMKKGEDRLVIHHFSLCDNIQ